MSKLCIKTLDQAKLDVANKTRSNIFNWRGQFTPEFVEYLLDSFASSGDTTFDPFCGSGTVLLESARRNLCSVGYEINPAAYAMARFVTLSMLSTIERKQLCESLAARVDSLIGTYHDLPLFEPDANHRDRYKNLLQFAGDLLSRINSKSEIVLALNFLFHAEKTGNGDLLPAIRRSLGVMKKNLLDLPTTSASLTADLCDARLSHERLRSAVSLILTSPPYINVFNYHQNYRAIIEVLGFDILKVAASEIGSNRKNRGNRFRTVAQYTLDMEQALESFAYCLKPGGLLILVIGRESRVRGIPFSNSGILAEVARHLKCYHDELASERVFVNRFGEAIKEDILVFRRLNRSPQTGDARTIAYEHLEEARACSSGDVADDISDAISQLHGIQPSPLFSRKGI